jgi:hypothetical protein
MGLILSRSLPMHAHEGTGAVLRLKYVIAANHILLAGSRLQYALKYNPNWEQQPRVPAGGPDGGQWTDGGGSSDAAGTQVAQNED